MLTDIQLELRGVNVPYRRAITDPRQIDSAIANIYAHGFSLGSKTLSSAPPSVCDSFQLLKEHRELDQLIMEFELSGVLTVLGRSVGGRAATAARRDPGEARGCRQERLWALLNSAIKVSELRLRLEIRPFEPDAERGRRSRRGRDKATSRHTVPWNSGKSATRNTRPSSTSSPERIAN